MFSQTASTICSLACATLEIKDGGLEQDSKGYSDVRADDQLKETTADAAMCRATPEIDDGGCQTGCTLIFLVNVMY
jgi:hypothetical protein